MNVIICCGTNGRAVVFGECQDKPVVGEPIALRNARMILRWDAACGGLFGLAATGPKADTRITDAVSETATEAVRQWIAVSDEAAEQIRDWPQFKG